MALHVLHSTLWTVGEKDIFFLLSKARGTFFLIEVIIGHSLPPQSSTFIHIDRNQNLDCSKVLVLQISSSMRELEGHALSDGHTFWENRLLSTGLN